MSQKNFKKVCSVCGCEILVESKHSPKRFCVECMKTRRKEKAREYYKEAQPESRVRAMEVQKKKRHLDTRYRLLCAARARARQLKIPFDLTLEDIFVPDKCPVFGTTFAMNTKYAASIDRVDPTKGYIKGNVQVLSWKANTMKNDASKEELEKFANWVFLTKVVKTPLVPEFKE